MPLLSKKHQQQQQPTPVNYNTAVPSAGNQGHQGNPNYTHPDGNLSGPGMNNRGYDDVNYAGHGAGNNNIVGPGHGAVPGGPGNFSDQQQSHQWQGYDGGNNNQGIPPSGVINHNKTSQSGGGGTSEKVKHAIGTMLGSESLKAKGNQGQQANAPGVQSRELAEAERLEREAVIHRERAVDHGAHPDHKHLGAPSSNPRNAGGSGNTNYGASGHGGTGY